MKTCKQYARIKIKSCLLAAFLSFRVMATAQVDNLAIAENADSLSFPVVSAAAVSLLYYDKADAAVVSIAAKAFKKDVYDISGKHIFITNNQDAVNDYTIIAGTIGHSALLDELIKAKYITIPAFKDNWETFYIAVINKPYKKAKKILVIAGNDRRGTAFGIFHLSRLMGVSPFVWWADITPAKRKQLFVSGSYTSSTPSVKYRGIFINDEDWGLQPWAARHMDTIIKDIGPNTYAKVFELMLRLKANYIWPAMHPCTKAFYYYKENPKLADDYAIVVGGSHCEPMLRNNVFEWAENYEQEYGKKPGEWRYDVNKDAIYKYWDDRIKEAAGYESVFTVGMRGVHDGSMPGPDNPDGKLKLLDNIINDQRKILSNDFGRSASEIPQIFVPYKEVLSLYRRGLPLAGDITIIWPDDNHGYIRQLPDENERKRSGGNGVYYHLSYWGAPQDYLWLSSISPSLIAYEMNKAWQYGARQLWVFNVGDIKPAELEVQFSMDMAWDITKASPAKAYDYTKIWAEAIFGKKLAGPIAAIKNEYYLLAAFGKPEHMNKVAFSIEQMNERLKKYEELGRKTQLLADSIPAELQDAYFELVMYPVFGAELMNEKILYAKSGFLQTPDNKSGNPYNAKKVREFFDRIKFLTKEYNTRLENGKWDGIMDWKPRDQAVFNMPLTFDSVSPAKRDSLQKLYSQTATAQFILPASSFTSKKETGITGIQMIPGLGINGSGITAFNKNKSPPSAIDPVYIEFELPAFDAGRYSIVVKCLPSFDVDKSKNVRYAIAVNDETPVTINIHVEADSKEWKENVTRGYSTGVSLHTLNNKKNKLRIYFTDYNLVINTVEFYKQ